MQKDPDFGELPEFCALNEDNPVKDAAKYRKLTHERNDPEHAQKFSCWGRTYVDGYGGGQSMGQVSYEGAIGGYLFKCPATGETHHKLYSSHEQFPAAVFQFLVHVEGEGHRCHELYVDTFAVNRIFRGGAGPCPINIHVMLAGFCHKAHDNGNALTS